MSESPRYTPRSEARHWRIGDAAEFRADAIAAMRRILDRCERERRDLSAEERRDYDRLDRDLDAATRDIEAHDPNRAATLPDWYVSQERDRDPGSPLDERTLPMSTTTRTRRPRTGSISSDAQARALGAIEQPHLDLPAEVGDRLVGVIERDRRGVESDYIAAISDPAYRRAFLRSLFAADGARQHLPESEAQAMERTAEAMEARGLVAGVPGEGGYAVPIDLDPTIILTSDGSTNPLRQLARVTTTDLTEWQGVTSEGVTASFGAELTEATDDAPELGGPKIKPEKAHAFVPFSIEVGEDWDGIGTELSRLFADARDNLEAAKYLTGDGADEPKGLLHEVAEASVVETATKEKFVAGDVYTAQEALPPRFQPGARWLSSLTIANVIHRFHSPSGEEPPLFSEDRRTLLSKPWAEVSGMSTKPAEAAADILVYGDLMAGFRIVDRIGMRVELVPHLFGENNLPKGQRGLYAYWRTGSKTIVPNAIRVLRVKAA